MKKAGILFLCLLMLSSCGETKKERKQPLYFLFAAPLASHTLWLKSKEGMEDACRELHVECDWKGPIKISIPDMEDVIETGLLKKADGFITQGVISKELIQTGMDRGEPFVLVDSPVAGSHPLATISKDFDWQAKALLTDIEKKVGKQEHLSIAIQVSDATFDLAKDQISTIEQVFAKHPGGYTIVAVSESMSDQLTSKNAWVKVFQEHKKINVAINLAGENAIGCVDARAYLKRKDAMLIYAVDDMKETLEYIKQGKIDGSVVTSFYQYGYEAVYLLYDYVSEHKKPQKDRMASRMVLVTKDNLTTYEKALEDVRHEK